jgi:hypothetical protein
VVVVVVAGRVVLGAVVVGCVVAGAGEVVVGSFPPPPQAGKNVATNTSNTSTDVSFLALGDISRLVMQHRLLKIGILEWIVRVKGYKTSYYTSISVVISTLNNLLY